MSNRAVKGIFLYSVIMCLALSGCKNKNIEVIDFESTLVTPLEDSKDELVISKVEKYRNMTYASFIKESGSEAEFIHSNIYSGSVDNLGIVFAGTKLNEDDYTTDLTDEDKVVRVEGKASDMITGLETNMAPDAYRNYINETLGINCFAEYCEGAGTAYYISDNYYLYSCDKDKDGFIDTELYIDLKDGMVGPDSYCWVCMCGNEVPMSAVGFRDISGNECHTATIQLENGLELVLKAEDVFFDETDNSYKTTMADVYLSDGDKESYLDFFCSNSTAVPLSYKDGYLYAASWHGAVKYQLASDPYRLECIESVTAEYDAAGNTTYSKVDMGEYKIVTEEEYNELFKELEEAVPICFE